MSKYIIYKIYCNDCDFIYVVSTKILQEENIIIRRVVMIMLNVIENFTKLLMNMVVGIIGKWFVLKNAMKQ